MTGPVFHISFDLIGAAIILLVLLLVAMGLVLLISWYWKRRLTRPPTLASDTIIRQLEVLLDSLPQGLLLTDREGQILWCNSGGRRLLSLSRVSPQLEKDLVVIVKQVAEFQQSELHSLQPAADAKLQLRVIPLTHK
jgi:sensor histidine kinase regulating citrate/malate metabolism